MSAANAQQTRLDQLEKQMETRAAEQKITNDLQLKLLQSLNDKIQPVQNPAPAPAPDGNDILTLSTWVEATCSAVDALARSFGSHVMLCGQAALQLCRNYLAAS